MMMVSMACSRGCPGGGILQSRGLGGGWGDALSYTRRLPPAPSSMALGQDREPETALGIAGAVPPQEEDEEPALE